MTLNLNDALLDEARRLSGIHEKTALVHHAFEELIARGSARALSALGATAPELRPILHRRTELPLRRGAKISRLLPYHSCTILN